MTADQTVDLDALRTQPPVKPPPDLLAQWLAMGRADPYISAAYDPPFTENSFRHCGSREELRRWFADYDCWALGVAFSFADICFVNWVEGSSDWRVFRHGIAFESISMDRIAPQPAEFSRLLDRLLAATPDQCRTCTY